MVFPALPVSSVRRSTYQLLLPSYVSLSPVLGLPLTGNKRATCCMTARNAQRQPRVKYLPTQSLFGKGRAV